MVTPVAKREAVAHFCQTYASIVYVREALAAWKDDYNSARPQSTIGNH